MELSALGRHFGTHLKILLWTVSNFEWSSNQELGSRPSAGARFPPDETVRCFTLAVRTGGRWDTVWSGLQSLINLQRPQIWEEDLDFCGRELFHYITGEIDSVAHTLIEINLVTTMWSLTSESHPQMEYQVCWLLLHLIILWKWSIWNWALESP